jgi:WD40 repeat protein
MARIIACLLLLAVCPTFVSGQSPAGLFLEQRHFASRSNALSAAVFLADGTSLATSSLTADAKGPIQLWDAKTGECTASLKGHAAGVYSLAASHDGKYLASGGDALVIVYESAGGKEVARSALPPGRILALAFAPSASILCAAGEDRRIHFLDLLSGKVLDSLLAHDEVVTSLAFSPGGTTLYSGSYDGAVKIWDLASRKLKQKLAANGGRIHGVAASRDGKTLAAACAANLDGATKPSEIAIWNLENTKQRKSLVAGAADFTAVQFAGTEPILAAARSDGWVLAWSPDGVPRSRLKAHHDRITSLAFAPDGKSLATTSWEPTARVWDLPRYPMPIALPGESKIPAALVYDAVANQLIAGGMDKTIRILDPTGKKPERQLQVKAENTLGIAVSPDGKFLATSGGRENGLPQAGVRMAIRMAGPGAPPAAPKPELITFWELETGKALRTLAGHQGIINVLAFSPNSLLLASGSADKTVRLWNVATGAEQMQLIGHSAPIVGLAFQPNGKTLATASDDGSVRLWDLHTGHELRAFQAHEGNLNGLAFAPDGRSLATCCGRRGSGSMALWDAETGENRWLIAYSGAYLSGVTFSPNGRLVMSAGDAETGLVRIVDVERGKALIDLMAGQRKLSAACLSADGKTLFTDGQAGDKGELFQRALPTVDERSASTKP